MKYALKYAKICTINFYDYFRTVVKMSSKLLSNKSNSPKKTLNAT